MKRTTFSIYLDLYEEDNLSIYLDLYEEDNLSIYLDLYEEDNHSIYYSFNLNYNVLHDHITNPSSLSWSVYNSFLAVRDHLQSCSQWLFRFLREYFSIFLHRIECPPNYWRFDGVSDH